MLYFLLLEFSVDEWDRIRNKTCIGLAPLKGICRTHQSFCLCLPEGPVSSTQSSCQQSHSQVNVLFFVLWWHWEILPLFCHFFFLSYIEMLYNFLICERGGGTRGLYESLVRLVGEIFASIWEEQRKVWVFSAMDLEFFRKLSQNPSLSINSSSSCDSAWLAYIFQIFCL